MRAIHIPGRIRESPPACWLRDIREGRRRVEWPQEAAHSASGDRVAVVVVNHNTRALISQLLFSLYRVLGRDQFASIVVVDNASKDGSLPLLQALMDAQLIHLIANKPQRYHGASLNQAVSWLASRQTGLKRADRIDYVWTLDSDTLILRRAAIGDALDVFRRHGAAVIGETFGERNGYKHFPLATMMFEPAIVWRDPVAPFSDHGSPEKRFLETATDAGGLLVPFRFLHDSYVLHFGEGTWIEVDMRKEWTNRFYAWADRELSGRRHFTYTGHPLGPRLHTELRTAYQQEVPNDTPQELARACLRDELIVIDDARPCAGCAYCAPSA